VIVGGSDKAILSFYLGYRPKINLFSGKKEVILIKKLLMTLNGPLSFSPLKPKEKSLYNQVFTKKINRGRG
jgi:hypothetical protein